MGESRRTPQTLPPAQLPSRGNPIFDEFANAPQYVRQKTNPGFLQIA